MTLYFFNSIKYSMRKYVFLNFFIQVFIVLMSVYLFFELNFVKFLFSFIISMLIFIPSIIEKITKTNLRDLFHVKFTIICLLLFIFLIVF